jgi:hypothetical protein
VGGGTEEERYLRAGEYYFNLYRNNPDLYLDTCVKNPTSQGVALAKYYAENMPCDGFCDRNIIYADTEEEMLEKMPQLIQEYSENSNDRDVLWKVFLVTFAVGMAEIAERATEGIGVGGAPKIQGGGANLSRVGQALDRNRLTRAGRAFQKHGSRNPGLWGQPTGSANDLNVMGQTHLDEIVNSSDTVWTSRHHAMYGDILEGHLPDGRGARWSADGSYFFGFLD